MEIERWLGAWLPPVGYAALIFYLSAQPSAPRFLPSFWSADKLLHGLEYGIFGVLLYRAIRHTSNNWKTSKRLMGLAFAIVLLYGISDEFHQSFVPNREASIFDVLADVVGGGIGIFLAHKFFNSNQKVRHD